VSGPEERADGGTAMTRYGFNIRTRTGQRVDNICIMAANQSDAERRLRQMYQHCEIVHCQTEAVSLRNDSLDLEGVIGIISNEPATIPAVVRSMLRNKSGTH
jgi:hypothetical protein